MWVRFGFGVWCLGGAGSRVWLELGTQGSECTEGAWDVNIARTEAPGLSCWGWEVCTGVAWELGEEPGVFQEATEAGTSQ